jgi:D-methionine transport system substrate-binding protein
MMMKNHLNMKLLLCAALGTMTLWTTSSCKEQRDQAKAILSELTDGDGGDEDYSDDGDEAPARSSRQASWNVDGNTMTYGNHTYTMNGNFGEPGGDMEYVAGGKAKVTFTNVPSDMQEYQTVYEQFLGKTGHGVAAMLPMAFEMWGRNHDMGKEALQLITCETCYKEIMRQLPAHMERSEYSPADDPYVQRCLPAAVLEGANKENGYNPTEPYTVNMTVGQKAQWGQESEILQSYVYQLYIISGNAWNTTQRSVTVMQPWRGTKLFKVNGCPSLYVNIFVPRQDWNGLK